MTVQVGTWEFEGPFSALSELRDEAGIYAVFASVNEEYELLEIDESESVREWLQTHDRYFFGNYNTPVKFSVAVYYCSDLTPGLRQGLIEELLREYHDLPTEQTFSTMPPSLLALQT